MRFKKLIQKNIVLCIMAILAMMFWVSGCGKDQAETEDDALAEVDGDAVIVSSLEDFLEAIEPGANIVIKKGTYDFTPELEKLYGKDGRKFNKNHEYVRLEDCFDGIQFVIQNVDGLTISGQTNKYVEIQVEPRYADVLAFENCSNITISNMTIGHTIEQGSCAGDVLSFDDSENITLTDLDLYGCGTYGICAHATDSITMTDSIIRDCSYGIMELNGCDATFTDCEFTGCEGFDMLELAGTDVTFSKCTFNDNDFSNGGFIAYASSTRGNINFKKCVFGAAESKAIDYEAANYGSNISFDSKCQFDDSNNVVTNDGSITTVEDFIEAIEPYANVCIEPGYYNLTDYINSIYDIDEWNSNHEYVQILEVFDGWELSIVGTNGLYIHSSTGDYSDVEIVVEPRYADVLEFDNCIDTTMEGITMGHTDTGDCSGSVLSFNDCSGINLDKMDLYGCGVYGIDTWGVTDMFVYNTIIRECSDGPFELYGVNGPVYFENCEFYGSNYSGYVAATRFDVEFVNCYFGGSESGIYYNNFVKFYDCQFEDGYFYKPENHMGGHEDIDGLETISYLDFCKDYHSDGEDTFWYAFELEKKKDSQLMPYFESDDDIDPVKSVLGLFEDGTGYIKGLPGEDILYFTWQEDADDMQLIITEDDGRDIIKDSGIISFYKDDTEYNAFMTLQVNDMTIWYCDMY